MLKKFRCVQIFLKRDHYGTNRHEILLTHEVYNRECVSLSFYRIMQNSGRERLIGVKNRTDALAACLFFCMLLAMEKQ